MSRAAAPPPPPPELLLSARSLDGITLATRDRLIELGNRFREPASLGVTLSKAVEAGVDGVLVSATPALHAALEALQRDVPLYVTVPAVAAAERHDMDPGLEDTIERRTRDDAGARFQAGLASGLTPSFMFRGDFVRRLPILVAAELAMLPKRMIRGVVLDAWFTDLALAAGNRRLFETFVRVVRRRHRVHAAFETHNLGVLLARLREWEVRPDFVLGPVNPSGLQMKPSVPELLTELGRTDVPVVARELCAGGVDPLDTAARYARSHGVRGLAPDLVEMDDVGAELRALRS